MNNISLTSSMRSNLPSLQAIADSGYKGINLFLEQNLRISFNED